MTTSFSVGVYHVQRGSELSWRALIPDRYQITMLGPAEARLRERMIDRLRAALRKVPPGEQELFQLPVGAELVRLPIDVKTAGGRLHGVAPLIVEPRWTGPNRQQLLAYHPERRDQWLTAADPDELASLAPAFFRHVWADLDADTGAALLSNGRDRLVRLGFSCEPRSVLDDLPSRTADTRATAAGPTSAALRELAVDETQRIVAGMGAVALGVPRPPFRDRLAHLLGGVRPRSIAVVGPPGAGKTELIHQAIADRATEDGYPIHGNLDRVRRVWRLSGKRLIAGMSHLGEWEARCLALIDEVQRQRALLWIDDLHLFGRLGQSRESERCFADVFRGPVRRGDLAILTELTAEQLARLERDAPGLAEALTRVTVPAASTAETAALVLHEVRAVEARLGVAFHPFAPRAALELGAALFPWRARPGVAIELVRRVAEQAHAARVPREISAADVLDHLARATGLPPRLISLDEPLDPADVEAAFAARVIGQPAATRAAADVILRVRAGLADPRRPVSVMLFTGPTGTGKTELATAIAEYLYGDQARLIRIDMGELSGPGAVARLIGDRWAPEGLLTARVRAQPFCVVLLDEIEKAHPHVLHLLLQLFDDGRLTDAAGDVTSFASAVVIMTSNLGARTAAPIGFGETRDRAMADVARAVREFFPVELFNRIDEVVAFEPLTPEIAARVVDKELARLLSRRGLRERNTFVYAGAAVRRRAVADAFDPRYGARTVKRWLEDRIGGALTDLLATAPPARLRIVRIAERADGVEATLEPLRERAALAGPYLLDGALDAATGALEPLAALAADAIARVRSAPAYRAARARATGELRYYVEELEDRLDALTALLGPAADRARSDGRGDGRGDARDAGRGTPEDPEADADADAHDAHDAHDEEGDGYARTTHGGRRRNSVTRWVRARVTGRDARPATRQDELVAAIAEALLLTRAVPTLLDPDAHAVTVTISRIGATADAAGLSIVARALAQPGWFDGAAAANARGEVIGLGLDDLAREQPATPDAAGGRAAPRDLCLTLRGLFVGAALAHEHGTWMVRATASEPDVVRVEVQPGAAAEPRAVLAAHLAARRALERALDAGGDLPPNPDALLPVTRALTYRPPLRPGDAFGIELEDFATGWVDRSTARDLTAAIRRAWHLGWSRKESP